MTNATVASGKQNEQRYVQDPIAVVGMACRLPGNSNSIETLWNFLESGGVARNEPPESRFDFKKHYDGSKKPKTMRSPGGMFLEGIDPKNFDAQFFSIGRDEATAMDPQQRQLLEVVYECLENAGVTMEEISGAPVACFVGSYSVDYEMMQSRDPDDRAPGVTVGIGRAILSNRISHFLNLKGPSMTVDTACSGSLVSLDVAVRYLQTREVNGAIIAASNLYMSPEHVMDTGAMKGASSLSGKCHTFDVKADGYIKAEAVNCVMLKRLEDAIRDGDPIRGVIRGTSTNSDGWTPGIASPNADAQAVAIRAAYANAQITDLSQTGYLECHGTGTQAGDPTEVKGASSVFSKQTRAQPLVIGSIKSNIGHSEPAAGISGLLKALLAVEKGIIPGNPTFITPNPKIDFQGLNLRATRSAIPWPSTGIRRASVNSFGYGGSNAHVVLEEAGAWAKPNHVSSFKKLEGIDDFFGDDDTKSRKKPFTLVFSANDEPSLRANVKALKTHLLNPNVKVDIDDLAYTLSERRSRHFYRGYIAGNTLDFDESSLIVGKKSAETPKIGFVFTGQGAQWSQMGKQLVDTFPQAKVVLQRLDDVLQKSPNPPTWSLLKELTEVRTPAALRKPEFSQPLVTALQLVILDILKSAGIQAQAVVGHSSGEIAAAHAAGLLSEADAILTAFYRGQAALAPTSNSEEKVGMMAVGVSAETVSKYFDGLEDKIQIACYNSPNSLTISGRVDALDELKERLVRDGHFARALQVDLAYHSKFMNEIGEIYLGMLNNAISKDLAQPNQNVRMFSSVYGREMDQSANGDYWKANMVNPVKFDNAVQAMATAENGPDFLIEIGPSGALAGPVAQIKKQLPGGGSDIQYCAALARGQEAIKALYDVAGKLFIAGGAVDLLQINSGSNARRAVITDLPNYSWNYQHQYWYESEASKDWRYRMFPHHDLIGTKVLSTSYHAPVWKKALSVDDLPWLKDHKMGPEIVFPAAGFMAMAIEGVAQINTALNVLEEKPMPVKPAFRVRNATFPKALVLEEGKKTNIMLSLAPRDKTSHQWYKFKVTSLQEGVWNEHSSGLVRIEEDHSRKAKDGSLGPLSPKVDAQLWYKAMSEVGYGFGPLFQKQLEIESLSGSRTSRSTVDLSVPASLNEQSNYAMHPASIDGCLQTCAPSLWKGNRSSVSAVLIPAIIDDVLICTHPLPAVGLAQNKAKYVGLGRPEEVKNWMADAEIYDQETGDMLMKVSGMRFHKLETQEASWTAHKFSRLAWKPDVTFTTQAQIASLGTDGVTQVLDLASHKNPTLRVAELNMIPGSASSLWLDSYKAERAACQAFDYSSIDAEALTESQEKYSAHANADFQVRDITGAKEQSDEENADYDLVIVKLKTFAPQVLENALQHCQDLVKSKGSLLLIEGDVAEDQLATNDELNKLVASTGFEDLRRVPTTVGSDLKSAILLSASPAETKTLAKELHLAHFAPTTALTTKLADSLKQAGWSIVDHTASFTDVPSKSIVLVLDELSTAIMPTLTEEQWEGIRTLTASGSKLLWLTEGSQMDIPVPEKAMFHGLARTIRSEDPSISITTLDVGKADGEHTMPSIAAVLKTLLTPAAKTQVENEYVERQGLIHVARLFADDDVNTFATEQRKGRAIVNKSIHDSDMTIRYISERLGTFDSLTYAEVPHAQADAKRIVDPKTSSSEELPLLPGRVEVEIKASGLNFKDLAVTMGIVPENEHLLGLEGAGVIRRPGTSNYKVGQRVLIFEKGTFANRLIATTERVYPIPDSMTFEQASTLASVFLVSLYSLYDLADTQPGQRVLIHSASGGLGVACIQICKYIGAEVFATVGTEEKRKFLTENYGVPDDHIFNSRTTEFGQQILDATNDEGVDVIINSLTGDLLEESWRIIREGGTMVELGKKDMLDRNSLSMAPFGRNVSYRCFDMAHKNVSDALIARLLRQLFTLIRQGHLTPVEPITTFPFEDIPGAFRYMRGANHLGKIVITNGEEVVPAVPVRPAHRKFTLRPDVSYLLVGGLKGLCGSLAIELARHGAKRIVVIQRSGYDDEMSQSAIKNIRAEGCELDLMRGDVANYADVERVFKEATLPIAGVIQGAMVLRDTLYDSMTHKDYHDVITCKVAGTWNLHNVAAKQAQPLDFFSMLSSISGVVGQKGQANYAAANAFLDAFAVYRRQQGLAANSIDLGAVEEIGYISRNSDLLQIFDPSTWFGINEALFYRIVEYSITQQVAPINPASSSQLITGIAVPLGKDSSILADARFAGLAFGNTASASKDDGPQELKRLRLLLKNKADAVAIQGAVVDAVNQQAMKILHVAEPLEPAKPLSSYGLDSLAGVELRNWIRMELNAEVSVLEISSAASLIALGARIAQKIEA
ncbi:hypothetical protein BDV96DRAFT_596010 [Lophiotrema nucula]|uniref:Uncharacterized protein n=1 Tax=Lophiotrema nucula TaxID=690887 RepID=A0A6A5ZJF6_9PLEO|nr:hypothetical protein BDV96DRAFT_596010 [Lophiotrema nucula]